MTPTPRSFLATRVGATEQNTLPTGNVGMSAPAMSAVRR